MNLRRESHFKKITILCGLLYAVIQSSPVRAQVYDYSYDGKVERTTSQRPPGGSVQSYVEKAIVQAEPYSSGIKAYKQDDARSESRLMREELRQFAESQRRTANNSMTAPSAITAFRMQISPPVDWQCEEMIERLQAEHAAALQDRTNLVKRQLDMYQQQLNANLAMISRKSDHAQSDTDSLKAAYANNVAAVNFEAKRNAQELDDYYSKKIQAVAGSHDSLKEQIDSHTGNNRVVQRGTNMYVHNYLNFSGSSNSQTVGSSEPQLAAPAVLPASLTAVAKTLNHSKSVRPK